MAKEELSSSSLGVGFSTFTVQFPKDTNFSCRFSFNQCKNAQSTSPLLLLSKNGHHSFCLSLIHFEFCFCQKKSHSTLRAKRATFTFGVDTSCPKLSILASFWKPKACDQTVLPDRSVLIGEKLVGNTKMRHFESFLNSVYFCYCIVANLKEPSLSSKLSWDAFDLWMVALVIWWWRISILFSAPQLLLINSETEIPLRLQLASASMDYIVTLIHKKGPPEK